MRIRDCFKQWPPKDWRRKDNDEPYGMIPSVAKLNGHAEVRGCACYIEAVQDGHVIYTLAEFKPTVTVVEAMMLLQNISKN